MDRRSFNSRVAAAALGAATLGHAGRRVGAAEAEPHTVEKRSGHRASNPICVSTYSYWRYRADQRLGIGECIDLAAASGFDAVEVLHRQMDAEDNATLQALKRRAFHAGMPLVSLSTHQDFLRPDPAERKQQVENTKHYIELANAMGMPIIRVSTGRWNTSENFNALMANRGIEPPIEGYNDEDGFGWVRESLEELLPVAEKNGVTLGVENHWGLARTAEGLNRIVKDFDDTPWVQVLVDTGNFLEDPYDQIAAVAPRVCFVQAKTYYGGGTWYTLNLDYDRIAKILHDVDYRGYISLEFEGQADAEVAIPQSLALLRNAFRYDV
ncbi:MAG: sugar phosphate isomerase/epimerase family protein [Phycisphaeraceae bacterium]